MALEHHTETATYRPRSCFTIEGRPKRKYPTRQEAMRAASRIEEIKTVEMNAYWCDRCHGWHVGKRPEWLV